jgi:predicted nuclease with TOPRIM domain
MWPFSGKKQQKEPEDTGERLDRLEKAMRRMEEDWSEVYGKFRTLQMRVAKQAQRAEQASAEQAEGAEREAANSTSSGVGGASNLSPRAQLIQRQILERRQRLQATPQKEGE